MTDESPAAPITGGKAEPSAPKSGKQASTLAALDAELDEALEETFPASDPIAPNTFAGPNS